MADSLDHFICDGCGLRLPLRPPRNAAAARMWQCVKCGLKYRALFDLKSDDALRCNVRPRTPEPKIDEEIRHG